MKIITSITVRGQRASRRTHASKTTIDNQWRRGGKRGPQRGRLGALYERLGGLVF